MTRIEYEVDIQAPVATVFEYYTNPDNIKETWPREVVKESYSTSDTEKNEEGSEMKVKGQYMGIEKEMKLQVAEKEQDRRLVTRQIEGPFKKWESIQEFQGDQTKTHVKHTIEFELPTTGKVAEALTGSSAETKVKQGLQQSAETVKQKLEGSSTSSGQSM